MTWHLKDRELENKLIAIDHSFVKTLTVTVKEEITNNWFDKDSITEVEIRYGGVYLGTVKFFTHELEEVPEYNRHDWNKFPAVKPPYNTMMRVDFENFHMGFKAFYKHFEDGDCWCYPDGILMPKAYSDDVKRFRSWED